MNKNQCTLLICIIGGLLLLYLLMPCNKHKKNNDAIVMIIGKNKDNYVHPHNWNENDSELRDCMDNTCCLDGVCNQNSKVVNDKYEIDFYDKNSVEPMPYDINTQSLSALDLTDYYTPYENNNYLNREARDMNHMAF